MNRPPPPAPPPPAGPRESEPEVDFLSLPAVRGGWGLRLSRTLLGYVARGILLNALVAFIAIEAVQGIVFFLRATEDFNVDVLVILPVLFTSFGEALVYAVPIALLLGTGLFIGRLNADREILALRSFGVSPLQLLLPICVLGVGFSAIALYLNHSWVPRFRFANRNVEALILDKMSYLGEGWNLDLSFGGQNVWIYHHNGPELEGIFVGIGKEGRASTIVSEATLAGIGSLSYPIAIFAERGLIDTSGSDADRGVVVELRGVNVLIDRDLLAGSHTESDYLDNFRSERITWSPPVSEKSIGIKDRTTRVLLEQIRERRAELDGIDRRTDPDAYKNMKKRYDKAVAVFHRRNAISLAALTFPLAAFALGMTIRSSNRLLPFFIASTIVPAVYFSLEIVGKRLAERGIGAGIVEQGGNLGLLLLCVIVLAKSRARPRR